MLVRQIIVDLQHCTAMYTPDLRYDLYGVHLIKRDEFLMSKHATYSSSVGLGYSFAFLFYVPSICAWRMDQLHI